MPHQLLNEKERLETLYTYGIMDTEVEAEFDNLASLAAQICEVPVAKINFLDDHRIWSKANYGNDIVSMPREDGFCQYTIQNQESMVVENAAEDERFMNFDFVKSDPNIRFYAGYNIRRKGQNLGTICVLGMEPKKLTEFQHKAMDTLAKEVEARLELRKRNQDLQMTTAFLESSVDLMLVVDAATHQIERVSSKVESLLGLAAETVQRMTLEELFPDARLGAEIIQIKDSDASASFKTDIIYNRGAGDIRYLEVILSQRQEKWLISVRNITKRKIAEQELHREKELSDTIINTLPVNFFMYDEDGNAIRWRRKVEEGKDYTDEEYAEMGPLDFFTGKEKERIEAYIANALSQKEPVGSIEANVVRKDKSRMPYLINAASFVNEGNKYLIGTAQDIRELKEQQEELKNLLSEKEVLLAEVHHRVKNNLAVISGFLQLEEFIHDNPEIKSVLLANHMRVKSMALIHEKLYQANNFTSLKLKPYLTKLINDINENLNKDHLDIELDLSIAPVSMNLNQAVPCALIVNELVSNAFEFAFQGLTGGKILVELKATDKKIYLKVEDDGVGLPDNFVLEESPTLSATLVSSLSEQIDSEIKITSEPGAGTRYELCFQNKMSEKGSSVNMVL